MRIVTDKQRLKRNRQLATWSFLLTMAVLIGSFIFVNYSLFTGEEPTTFIFILQALALPVAFGLTLFSIRMTNRWARQPYPEKALEEGLKGVSKRSVLYHYYHDPARHILVAPQGIFAIETRWHTDEFSIEGDNWKTHKNVLSRIVSGLRMDGIGNPTSDARHAADHVESLLESIAPDVEVQPLIVFINPNAELHIDEPSVPVLYASEKREPNLSDYMRELNREQKEDIQDRARLPLSQEQLDAFEKETTGKVRRKSNA